MNRAKVRINFSILTCIIIGIGFFHKEINNRIKEKIEMSKLDVEKEYIDGLFRNKCPFCLSASANWEWEYKLFRRVTFSCGKCNAALTFKLFDIEQKNYRNANIIVENANGHYILKQYEGRKINLLEFMNTTILPHRYRPVKHIDGKGFPDSCRTCDFGKNTDHETTICNKFWLEGTSDHICDQYSDLKWRRAINVFIK